MPLISGDGARVHGEAFPEVFEGLQERIGAPAHRCATITRQQTPNRVEPVLAAPENTVNGLQGKRQAKGFGGGFY